MRKKTNVIGVLADMWESNQFGLMRLFPNGPPSRFVEIQERVPTRESHEVYNTICERLTNEVMNGGG